MELRKYQSSDLKALINIFYETIRAVNIKDYDFRQIEAWSNQKEKLLAKNKYFTQLYTVVAIQDNKIIGYGNIDNDGYLDHLFVHKDYQGLGVASAICDMLEYKHKIVTVHASITAKPFFSKRGYREIKKQAVSVEGVFLTNYLMKKEKE